MGLGLGRPRVRAEVSATRDRLPNALVAEIHRCRFRLSRTEPWWEKTSPIARRVASFGPRVARPILAARSFGHRPARPPLPAARRRFWPLGFKGTPSRGKSVEASLPHNHITCAAWPSSTRTSTSRSRHCMSRLAASSLLVAAPQPPHMPLSLRRLGPEWGNPHKSRAPVHQAVGRFELTENFSTLLELLSEPPVLEHRRPSRFVFPSPSPSPFPFPSPLPRVACRLTLAAG